MKKKGLFTGVMLIGGLFVLAVLTGTTLTAENLIWEAMIIFIVVVIVAEMRKVK